ncbi:hypothetical protein AB2T90_11340 [Clostridium butyricum]|uniref:hypothetical protein n=1 Tax=Clostridium butyricum TaxID=1492 RepID=UPI003465B2CE
MKKIILISGKARSGKDCGGSYIASKLRDKGYKVVEDRFAKYIKGYLKDYYYKDWNGETKTDEIREKLQKLGTEKIKEELNYKSFHAKRLSEDFQIVGDDFDYFIVTDTRFPDEIYTFKAMFGDAVVKTLRIERQKDFTGGLTNEHLLHKSEIVLDNFVFENVIYNIGTLEEYYNKLDKYINKIFMENKEELQKIASTMTKGEFIEKYHYNSSDCPEKYGLKESSEICNGSGNCTKCWEEAIFELEFKEKELNIIEASNLKNAKFIPVQKPVTINEVLNSNKLCKIKHKDLYYRNENYYKEYHSLEDLLHELTEDYSDARTILREAEWYLQED